MYKKGENVTIIRKNDLGTLICGAAGDRSKVMAIKGWLQGLSTADSYQTVGLQPIGG